MRSALRELLPERRQADTFNMKFGDQNAEYAITVGRYPDGRIGEVFIDGAKDGSAMSFIARDGAILISLGLQYGIPLSVLRHSVSRDADKNALTLIGAVIDRVMGYETQA